MRWLEHRFRAGKVIHGSDASGADESGVALPSPLCFDAASRFLPQSKASPFYSRSAAAGL
jgi:hypothetical protein